MEWTIPAFAFPAKAGTHLPTPERWKAELAQWHPISASSDMQWRSLTAITELLVLELDIKVLVLYVMWEYNKGYKCTKFSSAAHGNITTEY